MKVKKRRWTREEIEFLEKAYGHVPAKTIASEINRSAGAVRKQAQIMMLTKNEYNTIWSDEEDQYLIENYKKVPIQFLMYKLHKKRDAVYRRARMLGVSKPQLTPERLRALEKNLHTTSINKMCKFFEENA